MDLRLETPTLRSGRDVEAVVAAVAASAAASVKTVTLGPWSAEEGAESPEAALWCLLGCREAWTSWPLRSVSLCELRLGAGLEAGLLANFVASVPASAGVIRLSRLGLASSGALGACIAALRERHKEGTAPLSLDLSGNGLDDRGLDVLVEAQRADPALLFIGLNLSGNASVSALGLKRLLASPGLQELDVSECGLGPGGAQVLAAALAQPGCALRELSAYRCGLGAEGVIEVVAGAARAPAMRSVNVVANGQHAGRWVAAVGGALARALSAPSQLRVATASCPEAELEAARALFAGLPLRVILVPNEQNNYNRAMFLGD